MKHVATVKYISVRNCLGIVSASLLKNAHNSRHICSLRVTAGNNVAYLSATPSAKDIGTNWLCINGIYASKLGFTDGCGVLLEPVEPLGCARAWIEPVSVDDWEILELHAGRVEMQALDQIRLLWPGQVFPIWIDTNICIFLKTMKVEPSSDCSLLMPLTELIVAPKINRSPVQIAESTKQLNSLKEQNILPVTDEDSLKKDLPSTKPVVSTRLKTIVYFLFVTSFKNFFCVLKFLLLIFWKYVPQSFYRIGSLLFPVLNYRKRSTLMKPQQSWFDCHVNELPDDFSMIARVEPVLFEEINFQKLSQSLLNQPNTVFLHSAAHLDNCQPDVYLVLLSKYSSPSEKLLENRGKKSKVSSEKKSDNNIKDFISLNKCVVRMYLHPHTKHAMVNNWKMVCKSHHLKVPSCVRRQMNLCVSSKVCLQKLTHLPKASTDVKSITFDVSYDNIYSNIVTNKLIVDSFKDWIGSISDDSNPVPVSVGVLFIYSLVLNGVDSIEPEQNEIVIEALVTDIQTTDKHTTQRISKDDCTFLLSSTNLAHIDLKFLITDKSNHLPSQSDVDLKIPTECLLLYANGLEKEVKTLERFIELALSSRPLASALTAGGMLLRQTCILVIGAKGTGKSVLCRSLLNKFASDTTMHAFVHIASCGQWRGKKPESIKRICDDLLNELLWRQPSILLLEDLDQLIPASSNDEEDANPDSFYTLQLVSVIKSFFQDLTGRFPEGWSLTPRVALFVTSRSKMSIHRSMRTSASHFFTNTLNIELPTRDKRKILLKSLIHNCTNFESPTNVDEVIEKTEGFAAGDLLKLVQRASHLTQQTRLNMNTYDDKQESHGNFLHLDALVSALNGFVPASLQNAKLHKPLPLLWNDIGGLRTVKQKLQEQLMWPVKYRQLFSDCGLQPQSGILLFGPPGCGKTLIASVVASECGLNFISIKGPEVLSKYIGASEAAVRDLFSRARAASPCILFFDEFDSLAPKRGHDSTGVTDRVVNQLLTHLDGVEPLVGVTVMAATSRPDLLDPALLRPGRLDNLLYCPFPDQKEREEILISLSKKLSLQGNIDLLELAVESKNFTGADLKALLYNAQLEAVHETIGYIRSYSSSEKYLPEDTVSSVSGLSNVALETDDLYQSNGYSSLNDDEEEILSTSPVNAFKATAFELVKTIQDNPGLTNSLKNKPLAHYGYQMCFDDLESSALLNSHNAIADNERNSNIVYFSTLHHGRCHDVPSHVSQATGHLFNGLSSSHATPSNPEISSKKLLIANRHIARALEITRPSVTADERQKYELMYSTFVRSRERNVSSEKNYNGKKLRTTLS